MGQRHRYGLTSVRLTQVSLTPCGCVVDIGCKPLGHLPDDIGVHPVVAAPDHAPDAAGAEIQALVEAVLQLGEILIGQKLLDLVLEALVILPLYIFIRQSDNFAFFHICSLKIFQYLIGGLHKPGDPLLFQLLP